MNNDATGMSRQSLRIADLALPIPVCLAPMAGYTRRPFRIICREMGSPLVFTEVMTSEGIVHRSPQTLHYLESVPEERPIAAHIYGWNVDSLARAAEVIESLGRFDLVDINCGCPVPKITRKGAGVALMEDPDKIRAIVQAVSGAVSLPVTVKTRIGLSPEQFNISEVAQAIEEGGAGALFLHARFACDEHSGPVHLDALKQIKEERSIPVIGNGGIQRPHHVTEMMEQTGVDGVMVGRAAIGNPWIFREIRCYLTGAPYTTPSNQERKEVIMAHLRGLYDLMLVEDKFRRRRSSSTEGAACRRFRAHLVRYLIGIPHFRDVLRNLMAQDTIESVQAAVDELLKT